jgi:hypothetical protein
VERRFIYEDGAGHEKFIDLRCQMSERFAVEVWSLARWETIFTCLSQRGMYVHRQNVAKPLLLRMNSADNLTLSRGN